MVGLVDAFSPFLGIITTKGAPPHHTANTRSRVELYGAKAKVKKHPITFLFIILRWGRSHGARPGGQDARTGCGLSLLSLRLTFQTHHLIKRVARRTLSLLTLHLQNKRAS